MIRSEFDKSRHLRPETDAAKIETLKANAVRALSNYMLYESGVQDRGKLGMAMDSFHQRSLDGMARSGSSEEQRQRRDEDDVESKKS